MSDINVTIRFDIENIRELIEMIESLETEDESTDTDSGSATE